MTQSITRYHGPAKIIERIFLRKPFLFIIFRFVMYTVIMIACLTLLPFIVKYDRAAFVAEGGPVELAQLALILLSAGILAAGAWRIPAWRGLLCLLALFAIIAAVRELDYLIDRLIPVPGRKAPAFILILFAAFCAWYYRSGLIRQIQGFITSYPCYILWAGMLTVTVYAQLLGNGRLLETLMLSDYVHDYKRTVEELVELCGYFFITVGSIETVFFALGSLPQSEDYPGESYSFHKVRRETSWN
ncbi:MAG: hypothetical protein ACUBOA_05980 [Candidatus Loosdrechtia sp.]|uniref:hypothetical protein n=1 Tax=Candidatus Loosdrechtia sp. TaxID=3101272 RepID=UPI003A5E483F|nr:MAG: hypothetical protein QY305_09290 [Candidatus Jettenia sp. AMX2]